jgi:hypothetical protein
MKHSELVELEVLTAMAMMSSILLAITPYGPLQVDRCFGGTCRLYLQGRSVNQARNQRQAGRKQSLLAVVTTCLGDMFLRNVNSLSY